MSLSYKRIRPGSVITIRNYSYALGEYIFISVPYPSDMTFDQAVTCLCNGDLESISVPPLEIKISDDEYNYIETSTGETDGDHNCHHISVTGELSLVSTDLQPADVGLVYSHTDWAGNRYVMIPGRPDLYGLEKPIRTDGRWFTNTISGFQLNYTGEGIYYNRWGQVDYKSKYTCTFKDGVFTTIEEFPWTTNVYRLALRASDCYYGEYSGGNGYDERYLRKQYSSLVGYFFRKLELVRLVGNEEFLASQEAALSYQAYDVNLVEAAFDLTSLADMLPKRTADDIIKLLGTSRFETLPSKIIDVAKSLADSYLYNKYVVLPTVSDVTSLTGAGLSLPTEEQETVNQSLQLLAEQLVYKGSHIVSRYGSVSRSILDPDIGRINVRTNARIRAYPRYLKDMSDAAIIVENIGLALSAERLMQVIPYEFVAEWFLPIEESMRSIEYNHARLDSMWEITGLCLSTKKVCSLGDRKYNWGLSQFSGDLIFTDYGRHTDIHFPSTRLPSIGPVDINPSRLLQGSSLIITNL